MRKTVSYLRRNGFRDTWDAVWERLGESRRPPYFYEAPSRAELERQRQKIRAHAGDGTYEKITFSIIVPTYRTPPRYLRELIASVQAQSYPYWELILADATEDGRVRRIAEEYVRDSGKRNGGVIRFVELQENAGISGNTNQALQHVRNAYVGLLDHDDLLTPDALFEMAEAIRKAGERGTDPVMLYSDEDKCNGAGNQYYEPNHKEKFNFDLILSNNYVCHFMVTQRDWVRKLRFRSDYDGAQDYDFVLRVVEELDILNHPKAERLIVHVPKILYHWRCHADSTAENPESKAFAYEAGRRALQDYVDRNRLSGSAEMLKHVGFYRVRYGKSGAEDLLAHRADLGAAGGAVIVRGKIVGGRMRADGKVYYRGLPERYSGYLHRAALTQDAYAVDVRRIALRKELYGLFEEITGVPYSCIPGQAVFDASVLPAHTDWRALSLKLCRAVRARGYRILWCKDL
ncbi:MAG: glycosyltransferase [Muribaculum sp.]|nr:glycosyltransferase [Muribaculum sp.]